MALIPSARYPAQTDAADPEYPHGKARNAGTYQDGTGTPLERDWLNDDWGFKQALLAAGSVAPSGDADKVGASQYLDALSALATTIADARVNALAPGISALRFALYQFFGQWTSPPFALTLVGQNGGFSLEDGGKTVRLPSAGTYVAFAHAQGYANSGNNPLIRSLYIHGSVTKTSGLISNFGISVRDNAIVGLGTSMTVMAGGVIADPSLPQSTVRITAEADVDPTNGSINKGNLFILKLA